MPFIKLTKRQVAIVDEDDYGRLSQWKWWADFYKSTGNFVPKRWSNGKNVRMSEEILGRKKGFQIDHANLNTLDNRKANLRYCTARQNSCNRGLRSDNTIGFKGVHKGFCRKRVKFRARISTAKKRLHLGWFNTPVEAALAYNAAALKYHGSFARVNII